MADSRLDILPNPKNGIKQRENCYSIPVRFLFEFKSNPELLYLYLKLRVYAMDCAGYIPEKVLNTLSHRNRYINIPKMRKLGWITEKNQLISVKKILNQYFPDSTRINNIHISLNFRYLKSLKTLKNYIFALTEQYILSGKFLSETRGYRVWDRDQRKYVRERVTRAENSLYSTKLNKYGKMYKEETFSENTNDVNLKPINTLTSRISISMLENWGYKGRTVSRLRNGNINSYSSKEFIKSDDDNKSHYNRKLKQMIKYLPIEVTAEKNKFFFATTHELKGYGSNNINYNNYYINNNINGYTHKQL